MKRSASERILETAGELFASRGYGNVGINEIIARSGTAKASFYHHFPSKELLCKAWLKALHAGAESRWNQSGDQTPCPDRILEEFDALRAHLESSDFRGCPFTNTTAWVDSDSPLVCEEIEFHKTRHREYFRWLCSGIAEEAKVPLLGDGLFLLYSGAATESQNLRSLWPVEQAKVMAAALLSCFGGGVGEHLAGSEGTFLRSKNVQ